MRRAERCLVLSGGLRELVGRHHARQRGDLGDVEEHEQAAFEERGDVELPDRQHLEPERQGDAEDGQCAADVAEDHDALAVPAVDERARRQREQEVRQMPERGRDACRGWRAREREDQQRINDRRRGRAERRHHLPAPEQHVVPIPEQRPGYGLVSRRFSASQPKAKTGCIAASR